MPSGLDFFSGAICKTSPFYDERPADAIISLLVIHNMSLPPGQFGGPDIAALFTGTLDANKHPFFQQIAHLRVSAHCVIYRDGTVEQFVPFTQRAWHAGISSFQGRQRCNDFSIGIEMEGTDDMPFTDAQYQALATVSHEILSHFPLITIGRIVGHSDIAPGRKTDPGPFFDWPRYRQQLFPLLWEHRENRV
ncbi:1,6-anhydro-N-acetylmuramyl-L-alanine amidase AmpD [Alteromonas pelagimontana]|uniref:1,6-anhydro-N-acetylmuramyl-L-alanine amidase AmpD n=1 Tax=Alteromonas pelagimontana TaxID=1858656 RepID=A0A6M4MKX3_9ALTE|nr:1,6-anhydro-N-acetylmuramyl-L-alanine amidase AmpD [Alteromonas pelagimontana]QJR82726.1 1,6-anhydro-N-acetylmuramyl-L-alanine amidase AmpD [Alteromonas pelagimontana]